MSNQLMQRSVCSLPISNVVNKTRLGLVVLMRDPCRLCVIYYNLATSLQSNLIRFKQTSLNETQAAELMNKKKFHCLLMEIARNFEETITIWIILFDANFLIEPQKRKQIVHYVSREKEENWQTQNVTQANKVKFIEMQMRKTNTKLANFSALSWISFQFRSVKLEFLLSYFN